LKVWIKSKQNSNTKSSYHTYAKQYLAFVEKGGLKKDSPVSVALFLKKAFEDGKARSTVVDVIPSAVSDLFRFEDFNPVSDPLVTAVKAVVRRNTKPPKQKKPVEVWMLHAIVKHQTASVLQQLSKLFVACRDILILMLMMFGFLRESEAMKLGAKDVWVEKVGEEEVLFIYIEQSKNDQLRVGHTVVIPRLADKELCSVGWFELYNPRRMPQAAKFFHQEDSGNALSVKHPNFKLKACLQAIGVNPAEFGSHSLRRGGATAAVRAGVALRVVKRFGNWKSDAVYCYVEDSLAEKLEIGRAIERAV
jgi:integrase